MNTEPATLPAPSHHEQTWRLLSAGSECWLTLRDRRLAITREQARDLARFVRSDTSDAEIFDEACRLLARDR